MTATPTEVANALVLKQAAKEDSTLRDYDKISDWAFLQHAIVAKGDKKKAMTRLRNMQKLKEMYGIRGDGSTEGARRDLETFRRLYPGFLRSMVQVETADNRQDSENQGLHVVCIDMSMAKKPTTEEGHAVRLRVLFYLLQALNATIPSIRSGYFHVMDCEHMTWRNFSIQVARRTAALYGGRAYPVRVRQIVVLHATPLVLLFFRIIFFFLPRTMRRRVEMVGKSVQSSYFDAMSRPFGMQHLAASWGGAVSEQALVETLMAKLEQRYANVASFSLTTASKPDL